MSKKAEARDHEHTWRLTEHGYSRSWYTVISDGGRLATACYEGVSDWSQEGDGEMLLECSYCLVTKPVPDGMEIHYC